MRDKAREKKTLSYLKAKFKKLQDSMRNGKHLKKSTIIVYLGIIKILGFLENTCYHLLFKPFQILPVVQMA